VRMARIPQSVLYYRNGDDATVYEKTEHPYRYPEAHGVKVPQNLMCQARALAGLQVRHFAPTAWTLGAMSVCRSLTLNLGYGADPMTYLLPMNQFLVYFWRPPYEPIDPSMVPSSFEAQSGV